MVQLIVGYFYRIQTRSFLEDKTDLYPVDCNRQAYKSAFLALHISFNNTASTGIKERETLWCRYRKPGAIDSDIPYNKEK